MIPIIRGAELYGMHNSERCCFCRTHTRFVTNMPERAPRAQVPCCESCARIHVPVQVPGLQAYWDLAAAREEASWERLALEFSATAL
jgi:hypothetical protein